jgi:protein SCO1/2
MRSTVTFAFRGILALGAILIGPAGESSVALANEPSDPAADTIDYGFCGSQPVYPVIGFNFATFCGPRNYIVLGRRGRLEWLFPEADEQRARLHGSRQLNEEELARLTILAEAAQLAGSPAFRPHPVVYDFSVDFHGRQTKVVHGTLANTDTSANRLIEALRKLVPGEPLLTACANSPVDFSPTQLAGKRAAIARTAAPPASNLPPARVTNGLPIEPPKPVAEVRLIDQEGRAARIPFKNGRWQLVAFGYTHCLDVCPMTLHKVATLLKRLGNRADRVQTLFVSVDSARDDAARVKAFVAQYDARILGFTGDAGQLQAAANEFGVLTRRSGGETLLAYGLSHSSLLYLVDPQARIRAIYPAATTAEDIARDLERLLD